MGIKSKAWRPTGCPGRYTAPYQLHTDQIESVQREDAPLVMVDKSTGSRGHSLWCCGCMRFVVEPFSFRCGHIFCKSCIASTGVLLRRDFSEVVQDVRATIRCPVGKCKATLPVLPLINGDFRFHESHVFVERPKKEPKVSVTLRDTENKPAINAPICTPLEREPVETGKKQPRKSDDLFKDMDTWTSRVYHDRIPMTDEPLTTTKDKFHPDEPPTFALVDQTRMSTPTSSNSNTL